MLSELEAGLGYTFRDKSILENALTHSSYANENRERGLRDNERLEFLGDSILGFVVADYLYRSFPDRPEGELTRIRADLVCEKNLARAAGTISLGSFLLLGHGEEHGGGRKRDSIVSDAMESVIAASYMDGGFSAAKEIIDRLAAKAEEYKDKALLSLTHGQPATPTTLGKELAVYVYRLNRQLKHIENQEYLGKINGATGTFGAHLAACPDVDWIAVSREFVTNRMGLTWNPLTTQIESHDWQAELYSTVSHANRIMHNLCVDVWMYISRGVFAQVPVKGATGSSTMPHKVNPIRFENAEANFELSCSLLDTLSATLVESRWQRDLTDSTTQRNIGSALGYSQLALYNLMGGLKSIHPNDIVIERELDSNWEVLGESIQTAMRACELKGLPGMDKPYEKVKELMRGHTINKEQVEQFIDQQSFDPATAARLKALTPATYTGVAGALVDFDR